MTDFTPITQFFQIAQNRWLAITDTESTGWAQASSVLPDSPSSIIDEHEIDGTVFVTIEVHNG
jgi:hypothetical protein